jgi:hypothetical protein
MENMTGSKYLAKALRKSGATPRFFVPVILTPALARLGGSVAVNDVPAMKENSDPASRSVRSREP